MIDGKQHNEAADESTADSGAMIEHFSLTIFTRCFDSDSFTFVVGGSEKTFTIHTALLKPLSPYFRALIDGPMIEAQERRVNWPDVSESDFEKFAEWIYTGDYNPNENTAYRTPEAALEGFLTHARMFVFADRYFLELLARLAMARLPDYRKIWPADSPDSGVACIIALTQFCFDPQQTFPEKLQRLCIRWIVKWRKHLQGHGDLEKAIEASPELAVKLSKAFLMSSKLKQC